MSGASSSCAGVAAAPAEVAAASTDVAAAVAGGPLCFSPLDTRLRAANLAAKLLPALLGAAGRPSTVVAAATGRATDAGAATGAASGAAAGACTAVDAAADAAGTRFGVTAERGAAAPNASKAAFAPPVVCNASKGPVVRNVLLGGASAGGADCAPPADGGGASSTAKLGHCVAATCTGGVPGIAAVDPCSLFAERLTGPPPPPPVTVLKRPVVGASPAGDEAAAGGESAALRSTNAIFAERTLPVERNCSSDVRLVGDSIPPASLFTGGWAIPYLELAPTKGQFFHARTKNKKTKKCARSARAARSAARRRRQAP